MTGGFFFDFLAQAALQQPLRLQRKCITQPASRTMHRDPSPCIEIASTSFAADQDHLYHGGLAKQAKINGH